MKNANFKMLDCRDFQRLTSRAIKLICLAITLSLPVNLPAQQQRLRFERISLEHGLSQSIVHVIFQDSKGFLWFGAQDGLNKYDGYEFTVYKFDPFNSTSLSENYISSIYESRLGGTKALWIGTVASGLNRMEFHPFMKVQPSRAYFGLERERLVV